MIKSVFFLAMGIIGVVFNKALAKFAVDYHANFYEKIYKQKPGPWIVAFTRVGYVLVGSIFIVIAVLALFGIIEVR